MTSESNQLYESFYSDLDRVNQNNNTINRRTFTVVV